MFVKWITLEDRGSISFQKRGHVFFTAQYNKDKVFLLGKCQSDLPASHYKRFKFPKLRVTQLWHKHTGCTAPTWMLCITPEDLQSMKSWCELEASTTCCARVMKSIVSDPGVLCLLQASMKQRQITLSAWNFGKISDLPQFLTGFDHETGILIEMELSGWERMWTSQAALGDIKQLLGIL